MKTAESHIDEFFVAECKAHGLVKRGAFAIGLGIGFVLLAGIPLAIAAVKVISDIYDNQAEIKKLNERLKFSESKTDNLSQTVEV